MTEINEDQLVQLLKTSPPAGIEAAIDRYGGTVNWIAVTIIGKRAEDVEECVSDTFLRLWQSIERFDPEKNVSLKSYLCGIARHTALDCRRRLERTNHLLPLSEEVTILENLGDSDEVASQVSKRINAEMIRNAIESLPLPDRDIFICRYYFYEKINDIAKRLSLDAKTVENKLYRGKQKLKEALIKGGIIL